MALHVPSRFLDTIGTVIKLKDMLCSQDYMNFYCRTDDPMYIKKLKLCILTAIADNSNAYEIVSEITEYIRDINPVFTREAVKAVGRVALAVSPIYIMMYFLLLCVFDVKVTIGVSEAVALRFDHAICDNRRIAYESCLQKRSHSCPQDFLQKSRLTWFLLTLSAM